jgi:hypothetical protein
MFSKKGATSLFILLLQYNYLIINYLTGCVFRNQTQPDATRRNHHTTVVAENATAATNPQPLNNSLSINYSGCGWLRQNMCPVFCASIFFYFANHTPFGQNSIFQQTTIQQQTNVIH